MAQQPPYEITQPVNTLELDRDWQAEITFTVTNVSGGPLRTLFRVVPDPPASDAWFERGGGPEVLLDAMATHQVPVKLKIPTNTAEGTYRFRLDAYDALHPNDNFTKGATIGFTVGARRAAAFPWWIVVAVLLVVLAIGTFFYLRTRPAETTTVTPVATPTPTPTPTPTATPTPAATATPTATPTVTPTPT